MCFNKKCLFCIPVETGSLILGVYMSVKTGLGILGCIGGLIYVNAFMNPKSYGVSIQYGSEEYGVSVPDFTRQHYDQTPFNIGLSVALLYLTLEFAFSVVLAEGANNRKAGHLKAYFIYGVVKIVLATIGAIFYVLVGITPVGIILLVAYSIYALLLVMVYQAFKNCKSGAILGYTDFADHTQLVQQGNITYA